MTEARHGAADSTPPAAGLNAADRSKLELLVDQVVQATPVTDIHTHLYDPAMGGLLLWGIDELLLYHYLVAEAFRQTDWAYDRFWAASRTEQAELIWRSLFLEHSPVSEACRGVLTVLHRLGIDARRQDLPALRRHFAQWSPAQFVSRCMEVANVGTIYMTNSPFDDQERPLWEKGFARDERFRAALRIDPLLLEWPAIAPRLAQWGYPVTPELSPATLEAVRRFLADWTEKLDARYLMVSLPPDFAYPDGSDGSRLLAGAVLPHCRERGLPFALMLGVKRGVNPDLRLAGDGVGRCEVGALASLCAAFPQNRFLATMLAAENQHELCVTARKFRNLHVFGCWWFANIPSLIDQITRLRLELLGLSFTAQHSDARVMDQIVYKWDHSRRIVARVLAEKYADLAAAGWAATRAEIERDAGELLGGAFRRFCAG
jgi:hypothetical protein